MRQRNRGNRAISLRRRHAIYGPVIGIGSRAAIAKQNQLATALDSTDERSDRRSDVLGFGASGFFPESLSTSLAFITIDRATSSTRRSLFCSSVPRNGYQPQDIQPVVEHAAGRPLGQVSNPQGLTLLYTGRGRSEGSRINSPSRPLLRQGQPESPLLTVADADADDRPGIVDVARFGQVPAGARRYQSIQVAERATAVARTPPVCQRPFPTRRRRDPSR